MYGKFWSHETQTCFRIFTALTKLVTSSNKDLRRACASALWEIKGTMPLSTPSAESAESHPPSYHEAMAEINTSKSTPKIMMSYQWDSQALVVKIKDRLEKAGFSVWMDISNMGKLSEHFFFSI